MKLSEVMREGSIPAVQRSWRDQRAEMDTIYKIWETFAY